MKRFLLAFLLVFSLLAVPASAHPGGTDENGGHYNHGNSSYHYHHGYPAHQHTGGSCPYDFDDRTGESSGTPSSGSSSSHSGSSYSGSSHSAAGSGSSFWESLIPDFSGSDEDNFLLACYSLVILAALFLSVAFRPVRIAVIVAAIAVLAYVLRSVFVMIVALFAGLYLGYIYIYMPISTLIDWIKSRPRLLPPRAAQRPQPLPAPRPDPEAEARLKQAIAFCSNKKLSEIVPPPSKHFHIAPDLRPYNHGSGRWGDFFTVYAPVSGGHYYHADPACGSCGTSEACIIDALHVGLTPCPICAYPLDLKWYDQQLSVLKYCRQHRIPVYFDDGTPCGFDGS